MWFCCLEYKMIVEIGCCCRCFFLFCAKRQIQPDKRIEWTTGICFLSFARSLAPCADLIANAPNKWQQDNPIEFHHNANKGINFEHVMIMCALQCQSSVRVCVCFCDFFSAVRNIRPFDSFDCKIHSRFKILWCSLSVQICWHFFSLHSSKNHWYAQNKNYNFMTKKNKRLGLFSFAGKWISNRNSHERFANGRQFSERARRVTNRNFILQNGIS